MKRTGYPYFEVKVWGGRLPAPPNVRGTSIEKLFERGSIGGTRVTDTQRFENTPLDRRRLVEWVRSHRGDRFDIEYITSPRHHRHRIQEHYVLDRCFIESGLDVPHLPPTDDFTP
jgi:hypothetical protein